MSGLLPAGHSEGSSALFYAEDGALYHRHSSCSRVTEDGDEEMASDGLHGTSDEDKEMDGTYYSADESRISMDDRASERNVVKSRRDEDVDEVVTASTSKRSRLNASSESKSENEARRATGSAVALPKTARGIRANQLLAQQLRTASDVHNKTLEQHKNALAEQRESIEGFKIQLNQQVIAMQQEMGVRLEEKDKERESALADIKARMSATEAAALQEKQRAAALLELKNGEAAKREAIMMENLASMKARKYNEDLAKLYEKTRREATAEIERLRLENTRRLGAQPDAAGSTSMADADCNMEPADDREANLRQIKGVIQKMEADVAAERKRAAELEVALKAKNQELEEVRRREEASKESAAAMKAANDALLKNQAREQKEMAANAERLKADKEREVAAAQQQKRRLEKSVNAPAASRGEALETVQETLNMTRASQPPDEDHVMSEPSSSDKGDSPTHARKQATPPRSPQPPGVGRTIRDNIRAKKAAEQAKRMPTLQRKAAAKCSDKDEDEDKNEGEEGCGDAEEDGDDEEEESDDEEEDGDSEEDEEARPSRNKSKGKGKGKRGVIHITEPRLYKLLKQVVAEANGTPSPSPKKKTYTKSQIKAQIDAEAKKHSKDAKNAISIKIRSTIKSVFKLEGMEDWVMHEPPTQSEINAFIRLDEGSGPHPDNLRVDMRGKISGKWNMAVIQIILALVHVALEEDSDWLPPISDNFLRSRIKSRISSARSAWRDVQPKVGEDGRRETVQQVEERVIEEKTAKEAANRAGTRRCTKYNSRLKTVLYMVAKKSGEQGSNEDLELWRWLERMLVNLGKEGMSSDESALDEGGAPVYHVKKMPWRRRDAAKNLRLIDKQRFAGNGMVSKRGNKPGVRIITGNAGNSRRPAPPGRPKAMYDEEWLKSQHPVDLENLQVSEKQFTWHEYYVM